MTPAKYEVSAPALHAADTILMHFDLLAKPTGKVAPTRNNLAIVIDLCTQSFRIQQALDHVVLQSPWARKDDFLNNMDRIRDGIRMLELIRNKCPRYGSTISVPAWQKQGVEQEITRKQRDEMERFSRALVGARTVEDEQAILRRAGFVR